MYFHFAVILFIFNLDKFSDAREYELLLRGPPAVYNERRLFELPMPRMPSLSRLNPVDRRLLNNVRGKFFSFIFMLEFSGIYAKFHTCFTHTLLNAYAHS